MICSRSATLALGSSVGAALVCTMIAIPLGAGAAATDRVAVPAAPATSPPVVAPSESREGLQLNGWRGDNGRFPAKPRSPKPRRGSQANTATDNRSREDRRPNRPKVPTELRLNTGLCGRQGADGTIPGPTRCQPVGPDPTVVTRQTLPPAVVQPRPEDVTWEQVLAESRVVLFPKLSVKVQPKDRTLVNLDTIVYTDESVVSTNTITLLGFPIVIEATPVSYSWNFGDGTSPLLTTTPGKPYPSKEVTHKYLKRGAVRLTLTTNYAARFNVAGTGWQYVEGTIPVTGPVTPLEVREAVPVLVEPGG